MSAGTLARTSTEEVLNRANKTILVVEDERVVARDLQRSLIDLGYSVPTTAASAEQALLLAAQRRPDLVLMDIRIKGAQDGIEAATLLRQRFDVPIVYLTAYADEPTVGRAKATEPFGYLLKPIKTNELRSAVEIALFKHEMEKRLRERERWLTTTLGSIGDAIISTDAAGRINYMNSVAEALTGWKAEQALGRMAEEVIELERDDSLRSRVPNPLKVALDEARTLSLDCVLVRKAQHDRFISDSVAPIVGDDGVVLGAVMVFRDVSERRQLQRQVELADRLATLGTMAAGIAHEVNNPLSFVVANITYALEQIRLHRNERPGNDNRHWLEEVDTALGDAHVGAARVGKIVADLKVFTRPAPDLAERLDVNDILNWSIDVAGHEISPRGQVVRRFGEVPLVDANSTRLGQVFVNLLINAAHSLDPQRLGTNKIEIETGTDTEGRAVTEIRDNGCGMTPEVVQRIFEPFFTTKPTGQGTGLGLSVCHGIVRTLGGTLTFESEPGKGTVARVVLPDGRGDGVSLPPPERPQIVGPRGSVLVVDDEPLVQAAIRRAIGPQHTTTLPATSLEAQALLLAGTRFDLILCDLMMPDFTGMDLHDAILRRDPEQARRMIFLTGGAFTPRMVQFLDCVENRRLSKPLDLQDIRTIVDTSLLEMGPIAASVPSETGQVTPGPRPTP